jgi:TonB family protein
VPALAPQRLPTSVRNGVESAKDFQKALGWFLMRRHVLLLACAHSICFAQAQQSDAPEGAATSTAPASSSQSRQWACNPPDRQSVVAFPREAAALGLTSGHVLVQFTIEAGEVLDVLVLETTHPTFSEAAVKVVKAMNCRTEKGRALHGVRVRVPFDFRLQ